LLIFFSSHLFLDLFSLCTQNGIGITEGAGVALFYPLSSVMYSIDFNIEISKGYIVSSQGFGLLVYFIMIIFPCLFLDDIIDIAEKRHEKFRKAANELLRNAIKD